MAFRPPCRCLSLCQRSVNLMRLVYGNDATSELMAGDNVGNGGAGHTHSGQGGGGGGGEGGDHDGDDDDDDDDDDEFLVKKKPSDAKPGGGSLPTRHSTIDEIDSTRVQRPVGSGRDWSDEVAPR
eukprot:5125557-Pleurochrysis_carterae.AAC.1